MNVADPLLTWCYGAGVGKHQILAVGTGNGFQSRTGWLRQKASISSSENLSSTPATTNQDASPTCSEASPSRKRKRSRTP